MKVRKDFVTNSSSSSFILAFDDEKTIEEELDQNNENLLQEFRDRILCDVRRTKPLSKEEAEAIFIDEMTAVADYEIWCEKEKHGYECAYEYCHDNNPEYVEKRDSMVNEWLEEFRNQIKEKDYIVELSYGDDDNFHGELEHWIVPKLSCTITRFNHH